MANSQLKSVLLWEQMQKEAANILQKEPLLKGYLDKAILNCANESIAKKEYGDIYIRRVTIEKTDNTFNGGELDFEFSSLRNVNTKELFKEFISTHNPPLSEEVRKECESIFKVS